MALVQQAKLADFAVAHSGLTCATMTVAAVIRIQNLRRTPHSRYVPLVTWRAVPLDVARRWCLECWVAAQHVTRVPALPILPVAVNEFVALHRIVIAAHHALLVLPFAAFVASTAIVVAIVFFIVVFIVVAIVIVVVAVIIIVVLVVLAATSVGIYGINS